jgi:hypothetical protein
MAMETVLVPLAELVELEHADRAVPDHGAGLGDDVGQLLGAVGADVEDHVVVVDLAGRLQHRGLVLVELLAADHVGGDRDGGAAGGHLLHQGLGGVDQVVLAQGLADVVAGGLEEGVGDAAADHELVDLLGQGLQHGQLGGDLGAADDGDHRPLRGGQGLVQGVQLLGQQQAGAGDGANLPAPWVEAWARWAVPKASMT